MTALLERGLRDRRRAPLTWGGSLGAMCALIVAIWPSIEGSVSKLVESYPENLKQAFGISTLDSVEAYLEAEMFSLIVPLAIAFLTVRVVASALPGAEERGHLDTLLAAPVRRRSLVVSAMLVAGLVSALVLLVVAAAAWIAGAAFGTGLALGPLLEGVLSVWALGMLFAGVAALAAGFLHRSAPVTGIAIGIAVAMYVLDVVGKIASGLGGLRWASAFRYYGSALTDGLDPLAFVGLVAAGAACALLGALAFERRDIS